MSTRTSDGRSVDGWSADDCAATLELGRSWVEAMHRRDVDALLALADPDIVVYPIRLLGDPGRYTGHDGLRRWIEDIVALQHGLTEVVSDVRPALGTDVVVLGDLVRNGKRLSPFSIVMSLRDGRVTEAHSFLSDEDDLKSIGRLPR
jgi:ketosteroid isomerase-like protein